MTNRERARITTLKRRADRLASRLSDPNYRGDLQPTLRELSAVKWAVGVLEGRFPPPQGTLPSPATKFDQQIPGYADVMSVAEWEAEVKAGMFTAYDGDGYWCRDGMMSRASVFGAKNTSATHVAWFNK